MQLGSLLLRLKLERLTILDYVLLDLSGDNDAFGPILFGVLPMFILSILYGSYFIYPLMGF